MAKIGNLVEKQYEKFKKKLLGVNPMFCVLYIQEGKNYVEK